MNTINRIREIGFALALAAGLLIAASHSREDSTSGGRAALEMCAATKGALCPEDYSIAELGALTVTAHRATALVADLGAITVTAPRELVAARVASSQGTSTPATVTL